MEEIVQLHVKIAKSGNQPLTGKDYTVKFYDQDLLKDDFLGESILDDEGHALISITQEDFRSKDSPLEKYPDVYFTVQKNGKVIYKSPVNKNLHLKEAGDFSFTEGLHCDLGTFLI